MFANSGLATPLTQVNTRRRALGGRGRPFAIRLRRGSGRRHPVDDRSAFIIDLHARNERADQLPPLVPRESFEAMSDTGGEVLQATRDGSQGHDLRQPLLRLVELFARPLNPGPEAFDAFGQLLQVQRTGFVGIEQALVAALVARQHLGGFVALRAPLVPPAIGGRPARPLLDDAVGILQDVLYRLPNVVVELIRAYLPIGTDATSGEAEGVGADAAVVGVPSPAFGCRLRHGLAVVRVPAASADDETLQQVALAARISLREPPVPLQLTVRSGEDFGRHDGGHADVDPLLLWLVPVGALAPVRSSGPAANRAQESAPLRRLGLAVGGLTCVRRVAKDSPDRCPIPARCTPTRRDAVRVERSHDLADGLLLVHQLVVDPAHDLCLGQQHIVPRRLGLRLAHVEVAVRRARHRVDCTLSRPVQLATTTALGDLRALVLGDHALDLHQERVFRGVRRGPLEKDDGGPVLRELLQQQHLVRVAPGESIGVVHVDGVDRTLRDPIAQSLERGANQRRTAEAVVHVDVPGQHTMPVGDGPLAKRLDLALARGLLGLLLRGYARVQRDGLHATLPSLWGRVRPRRCWSRPPASGRTSRRATGTTSSYALRRWSADKRAGSKLILMCSRRRMQPARSTRERGS